MRRIVYGLLLLLMATSIRAADFTSVGWQSWSTRVFDMAAAQHRYVLLDLTSNACPWCDAMDAKSFSDATVQELMSRQYIPVRVDRDNRYATSTNLASLATLDGSFAAERELPEGFSAFGARNLNAE